MKCIFKNAETGITQVCHTLNGNSLALQGNVAALLENGQTNECINLPDVLEAYYGKSMIQSSP